MDISKLDNERLKNLIANHEAKRATDQPLYGAAIEEWHARNGQSLDLKKSIDYLHAAAGKRRFVSYGELATANGAVWDKVRYPMNAHLWALVRRAHSLSWPMLSAMVVNKTNLGTGEMDPSTLAGFIKAAKDLGYEVPDPVAFLKEQQQACFAWGADPIRPGFLSGS
jgi:hypothetical protein